MKSKKVKNDAIPRDPPKHGRLGPRRSRAEVDAIVSRIGDLMITGQWAQGASEKALSAELDVSISMIRQWQIQASRVVMSSADPERIEAVRAATVSSLTRQGRKAEAWASEAGGDRRLIRDAIMATVKAAEVSGVPLVAPPMVQVTVQLNQQIQQLIIPMTAWAFEDLPAAIRAGLAEDLGLKGKMLERTVAVLAARLVGAKPLLEARIAGVTAGEETRR